MQFTCEASNGSVKVHVGRHEGNYHPWWSEVRVEIYGWNSNASYKLVASHVDPGPAVLDPAHHSVIVTVPDDGRGTDLEISVRP